MFQNGQGDLVPFVPRRVERINDIGLSLLLEGSSFHLFRSVVAVTISADVDWTGFGFLDTWLPYCWEAGEVFDVPEGHKIVSRKGPLDGDVTLVYRALPARSFASPRRTALDK